MQKTVYDDLCFKEKSYLCSVPNMMNMTTKNIFAGFGTKAEFVKLIYNELMKRDYLTYADVLVLYYKRPKNYYDNYACNSEPGYGELKKAFPEVLIPTWIADDETPASFSGGNAALWRARRSAVWRSSSNQIKEILTKQLENYNDIKE